MSQETILLVDDEAHVVEALARTVRNSGYRILEASSGAKALEILARESVDLVISDIAMPEMSGLDLLRGIRVAYPRVLRFVLTGFASLESAITAINDGHVDRYLTKPWETEELRKTVREALDGRHLPLSVKLDPPLSPRLNQTLERLVRGVCPKDIATDLGVSAHTARQYVKVLYRRFDVTTRAELLVKVFGAR
ncbi:response regulator [Labilithrix luteola]|uniref:Response regulator n=1 Tax=Labilithrix luteola TaxID=1391654 RepID=A0A0K1PL02_9BACT|nr:response regulator [Labilithrix luteola]AKU93789.1 response regulator [Labilithrix luteola]